jgi:hypothetical protein
VLGAAAPPDATAAPAVAISSPSSRAPPAVG